MRQLGDIEGQIDANFKRRLDEVVRTHYSDLSVPATTKGSILEMLDGLNTVGKAPGVVLRFGLARSILDLGLLGYTVLSCPDIGEALDVIYRYHALTSREYQVHLIEQGDQVVLRATARPAATIRRVVIGEEFATGFWVVLSELLPGTIDRDKIEMRFDYGEPEYGELYSELMPCRAVFGADRISLSFPAEWGALRLQTADATVEEVCRAQCAELLRGFDASAGIVDDVRRLLLNVPANRRPRLTEIADQLMMSARTLERRLQQAGHSFRRIDSEVRMELAAQYVSLGTMSGKQVASALGYSEPAAFYRAFKLWHGKTPLEFQSAQPSR